MYDSKGWWPCRGWNLRARRGDDAGGFPDSAAQGMAVETRCRVCKFFVDRSHEPDSAVCRALQQEQGCGACGQRGRRLAFTPTPGNGAEVRYGAKRGRRSTRATMPT